MQMDRWIHNLPNYSFILCILCKEHKSVLWSIIFLIHILHYYFHNTWGSSNSDIRMQEETITKKCIPSNFLKLSAQILPHTINSPETHSSFCYKILLSDICTEEKIHNFTCFVLEPSINQEEHTEQHWEEPKKSFALMCTAKL